MTKHMTRKTTHGHCSRCPAWKSTLSNGAMMVLLAVLVSTCSSASAVQIIPTCAGGFSSSDQKTGLAEGIVKHVLDTIIEPQLGGNVSLLLKVELVYTLPANQPGGGTFTELEYNISGLIEDTWYGSPLASEITGQNLKCTSNPGHPEYVGYHMYIALNKTMLDNGDFWLYKDKPCPTNKADLVSVVLHEVGHALGFKCIVSENGYYNPYPDSMHSIMEVNMCGNLAPDPEMFTFDQLGYTFRSVVMQGGDVWWWGNLLLVVGQRRHAASPSDPMFSPEGFVQMNTPIALYSVSHWHPGHSNPDQVMEPELDDGLFSFMAREIGFLGPALQDMGWPDVTLLAAVPTHVPFAPTDMSKGTSAPQTVVVSNNRNGTTSITAVELLGGQADSFSILSGGSPTTSPSLERCMSPSHLLPHRSDIKPPPSAYLTMTELQNTLTLLSMDSALVQTPMAMGFRMTTTRLPSIVWTPTAQARTVS